MKIHEIIWPKERINHIAKHNVAPEEVEEICFSKPFIQKAKSTGKSPVYYLLGQTTTGKYLFCVIIQLPDNKGYPVTARNMTNKEKLRYIRWRKNE